MWKYLGFGLVVYALGYGLGFLGELVAGHEDSGRPLPHHDEEHMS